VPAILSGIVSIVSCGPVSDQRAGLAADLRPPAVEAVRATSPRQISVEFDEDAGVVEGKTAINPELRISEVKRQGKEVVILTDRQTPGRKYMLEAEATDARGNTASFLADFYGYNPRVPRLLINEFTTRGSGNHPDLAELKVLAGGDMGGVVLYAGTPGSFDNLLVFPSFAVVEGDFILVHFKPTGDAGEIDETADKTAAKGLDASDNAFDFWVPGGTGLSGNNGVLAAYERPGGKLMDGVLYSNRTATSDERYRGFGSEAALARAEELVRHGGWKPAGNRVTPEDAVNPEGSTGTRSICRSSASDDTDTAEDWHIVPTRKASFGAENSDERYALSP
jgi:hypothetical protein